MASLHLGSDDQMCNRLHEDGLLLFVGPKKTHLWIHLTCFERQRERERERVVEQQMQSWLRGQARSIGCAFIDESV